MREKKKKAGVVEVEAVPGVPSFSSLIGTLVTKTFSSGDFATLRKTELLAL